jgi:hypothetical protein
MMSRVACFTWSLTLVGAGATWAAQTDSGVTSFLDRARAATEKYRDQRVAITDGYRAIGAEAPAMGQHWLHPGLLVAARFDVEHPAILEYVTVQGQPVLAGVGYALPLEPGGLPPESPAGRAAWHSHAGGVEEESVRLSHDETHAEHHAERVAVLHAWVRVDNPAGPFAPLNWALPFVRAGLEPSAAFHAEAPAKALSLDAKGAAFWEMGLARALDADSDDIRAMHRVLTAYADTVEAWRAQRPASPRVSGAEAAWLDGLWGRLHAALLGGLSRAARERASALSGF